MNTDIIERRAAFRRPPLPQDAFGLRGTVDAVLQFSRLASAVFLLVVAAAAAYALLAPPVYRADALVQIDSRAAPPSWAGMTGAVERDGEGGRGLVAGEIEVLGSREVLLPAIAGSGADVRVGKVRRLGVVPVGRHHGIERVELSLPAASQDRDFTLSLQGGEWTLADDDDRIVARGAVARPAEFTLHGEAARISVHAAPDLPPTRATLRQLSPLLAHEDVTKRLRLFEPARESGVVRLSYEDSDPQRAAALLNRLVDSYLDFTHKRRADESARALEFLETQLPAARGRLGKAEDALSGLQSRAGAAATAAVEAETLLRQRSELERQGVELRVKRDQLSQTLTPRHPELAAVLRQIATVDGAIARLGESVKRLPEQQRDVGRLQREVQVEQQLYSAMLAHAQQLRILGSGWQASARSLDRASAPPEPVRPRLGPTLSLGLGAGLLLALAAVLVARSLQTPVVDVQELQSPAVPPTLAIIPESRAQHRLMEGRVGDDALEDIGTHWLVARAAPEDPAVDALRSVHLSLLLRERSVSSRVIMVTSPASGTGKSFVTANLAALMAEGGKRVLLVETDLRRPGLYRYLAMDEFAPGLSDMLAGKLRLDEVIHTHPSADMDLLLHGASADRPGVMLMSPMFEGMVAELRQRYDHIVINAPPMLPSRDALAVGRVVDFALMVVRAEHSRLHETRVALRRLEQAGIRVEGILLNGVKRSRLAPPLLT